MKSIEGGVTAAKGYVANALSCGIKKPEATRLDLALVYSELPTTSSGTFTTNRVRAACVRVSEHHLTRGNIRAIVANSGNANACTGGACAQRSGGVLHRCDWSAYAHDAYHSASAGALL